MNNLCESIHNYLQMDNTGALLVSGEWGCGKTFHIDNVVIPYLRNNGFKPFRATLFGISSTDEIPMRLLEYFQENINENYKNDSTGKGSRFFSKKSKNELITKGASLLSSFTWLSNIIDVKTLIDKHSDYLYNFIPKEKTVIFLDDIERVIDTIDIHSLLGAINGLVEQRGFKVIIIANFSYIQQIGENKLVFKEKVIDKTILFEPDVQRIFGELCDKLPEQPIREFLHQDRILSVINPFSPAYTNDEELQADLHNIRILKFAISHYHIIFNKCREFLPEGDSDSILFLYSLWACTVGLSIEYKKNRITYKDRESFTNYKDSSLIDFKLDLGDKDDVQLFNNTADKTADKQENNIRRQQNATQRIEHLLQAFVKKHSLPVVISPQLFDYVVAGISIDTDGLNHVWNDFKITIERNREKPSYKQLGMFLQSPWKMNNRRIVDELIKLVDFVQKGEFDDNLSYINANTILQHLHGLIGLSEKDIHDIISKGIDHYFSRVSKVSYIEKQSLDTQMSSTPDISRWVIMYIKEKIAQIESNNLANDIEEVKQLFNSDLLALESRLVVKDNSKSSEFVNYPILCHIPENDIVEKLKNIEPNEVMAIYNILYTRFTQIKILGICEKEKAFVQLLKKTVMSRDSSSYKYSDILIEDKLMKLINSILEDK